MITLVSILALTIEIDTVAGPTGLTVTGGTCTL
jgi:hypothetical protein